MGRGQKPGVGTLALGAALGLWVLGGCGQPRPKVDSCLTAVEAHALPQALGRCNAVVAAYPRDPRPLNDRFLLHTLLQNKTAACADIQRAAGLLKRQGKAMPQDLKDEVQVRLDSCY
ncbi:MAG: hypothetical protein EBU30_06015 [Synechococcaceae bacterium WB6_3B_236]|jgi:hypothetical protein|nr:hypothetical protein [Synechococcaceae bacterium WB6_3B_236]